MVVAEFEFPLKADAYAFRDKVNSFFGETFLKNENKISISVIGYKSEDIRDIWFFTITFQKDPNDIVTEKHITISGGTLDLMNGTRQVWAFA